MNRLRLLIVLTVFVILFSLINGHESAGLTIELPDREEMCFYEDFEGSRPYIFEYKVLKGGNFDVDVAIETPSGMEIYNEVRKAGDTFVFDISWGAYKFCFSNEFSTVTHKTIYFELRPEEHQRLAVEGGKKGPSANTQVEESMEVIHAFATQIMTYQQRYRLIEAKSRYEAERLNSHVQLYSIAQAVTIVFVGLGELIVLKKFFSDGKTADLRTGKAQTKPSLRP